MRMSYNGGAGLLTGPLLGGPPIEVLAAPCSPASAHA